MNIGIDLAVPTFLMTKMPCVSRMYIDAVPPFEAAQSPDVRAIFRGRIARAGFGERIGKISRVIWTRESGASNLTLESNSNTA